MSNSAEVFRVNFKGRTARCVYSDAALPVLERLGELSVTRASHVEPASAFGWECDGWLADMRPAVKLCDAVPITTLLLYERVENGVKIPFKTRQAALDAERRWLREHVGI